MYKESDDMAEETRTPAGEPESKNFIHQYIDEDNA